VLASASARRRELLARLGVDFQAIPSAIDETLEPGPLAPAITRLAERKARAVAAKTDADVVIAADTMVVIDGDALGKPADTVEAAAMLRRLREREHEVITGVAVVTPRDGRVRSDSEVTRVIMARYSDALIQRYTSGGETLDKAGSYAVQDLDGGLVDAVVGSYTNVVGLPLELTARLLREAGVTISGPASP